MSERKTKSFTVSQGSNDNTETNLTRDLETINTSRRLKTFNNKYKESPIVTMVSYLYTYIESIYPPLLIHIILNMDMNMQTNK